MAATNARRLAAFLLIAIFANGTLSCAQPGASAQELEPVASPTMILLQQMTRAAGIIFAGEVISVRRPAGYAGSNQNAAEGIVTIEFRVDDAVRGCVGGSVFTLREWAGLWTDGERYNVGQRLLIFLHRPNASGITSPVHGATGTIPLRGGGIAPGPYDDSALASDWLVDLRWVEAQAMRGTVAIRHPTPEPARPMAGAKDDQANEALAEVLTSRDSPSLVPVPVPGGGVFLHWAAKPLPAVGERSMQPLAQVLSLCRGWVRSSLRSSGRSSDGGQ